MVLLWICSANFQMLPRFFVLFLITLEIYQHSNLEDEKSIDSRFMVLRPRTTCLTYENFLLFLKSVSVRTATASQPLCGA